MSVPVSITAVMVAAKMTSLSAQRRHSMKQSSQNGIVLFSILLHSFGRIDYNYFLSVMSQTWK